MRVALDATYSVDAMPSGVGIYSQELIRGLLKLYPQDNYVRCCRWKQWRQSGLKCRPLLPPLPTFRADVFHALNQRVDRRPARGVVSTFHDLFVLTAEYSTSDFRERFTKQARTAAANSDLIIAVSAFTASQVEHLLGFAPQRIRVVPHGVHTPVLPRSEPSSPFVLCVGALQKRKNINRLVEAFEALPNEWRLVLAGSPGGYGAQEIIEQVERSPARTRIEITGYVTRSQLDNLYASATIFAFPSLDEGFGIPVLEAMAYGTPVLTSNSSALKELAAGAALLVDPLDTASIAHALLRLSTDSDLARDLALKGKIRSQDYTWENAAGLTHATYEELVG